MDAGVFDGGSQEVNERGRGRKLIGNEDGVMVVYLTEIYMRVLRGETVCSY